MENQKFKTKLELIQELGISRATFYRMLAKKNIKTNRQILSPKDENELRIELGFSPLPGFESNMGQIETY